MITNDQRMIWRTAYLQFLCEQYGIPYTGVERIEALETMLTNAGVFILPKKVEMYSAKGSTNDPSTTVAANTRYMIPDLTVEVPMQKGQKAFVSATISTRTSSGEGKSTRQFSLSRSLNSGSSWTDFGSWHNCTVDKNDIITTTLAYHYEANSDQIVTFGVRMASDGSTNLIAHANQRTITVIVS